MIHSSPGHRVKGLSIYAYAQPLVIGPPSAMSRALRPLVRIQGAILFRNHLPLTTQRGLLELLRLVPALGVRQRTVCLDELRGEWLEPAQPLPNALLLYLHGGGYCMGSPASHRALTSVLARWSGLRTFVLDYRLAPEHPCPAALTDTLAAYQALRRMGGAHMQIALAGDSAGGGLALAATALLRDQGQPLPAAVVALSPWTDLTCNGASFTTRRDLLLQPEYVRHVAELYLKGQDPRLPMASPLYAALHQFPPTFIQASEDEILLDDSVRFGERARAAGVDVTLEIWQGLWHVWQIAGPLLPDSRRALARVSAFLRQHLS